MCDLVQNLGRIWCLKVRLAYKILGSIGREKVISPRRSNMWTSTACPLDPWTSRYKLYRLRGAHVYKNLSAYVYLTRYEERNSMSWWRQTTQYVLISSEKGGMGCVSVKHLRNKLSWLTTERPYHNLRHELPLLALHHLHQSIPYWECVGGQLGFYFLAHNQL